MRGRLAVIATALLLVTAFATPATAITNGQPDNGRHPYVGLVVFFDAQGGVWSCSGSLISPTLVLTAGHCTNGALAAGATFEENVSEGDPLIPGIPDTHPDFRKSPYTGKGIPSAWFRDIGVVVLLRAPKVSRTAQLPAAGLVDTLKNKSEVDYVGYGVKRQLKNVPGKYTPPQPPPPRWRWADPFDRMYALSELVSRNFRQNDDYLRLSLNPSRGKGGSCFGDSGGPNLLGGTDTVLGVTSFGTNVNCKGVGYSSRVDTQEVLGWITGPHPAP